MTKDTDEYLAPNNPKSYLRNGRVTKDANGCLGPKNLLSPTYEVDGSSRTPTGALIMKFIKSTSRVDGPSRTLTGASV